MAFSQMSITAHLFIIINFGKFLCLYSKILKIIITDFNLFKTSTIIEYYCFYLIIQFMKSKNVELFLTTAATITKFKINGSNSLNFNCFQNCYLLIIFFILFIAKEKNT